MMYKAFIKFVNGLGDWNHAFGASVIMVTVSFMGLVVDWDASPLLWDLAQMITAWYMSKEYHSYIAKHGYIKAFNPSLWSRHDRRQTVLLFVVAWLYAFMYDKYIFNLISTML